MVLYGSPVAALLGIMLQQMACELGWSAWLLRR